MNYNRLIRNSFLCGLILVALGTLSISAGPLPIIFMAVILPGFIYTSLYLNHKKPGLNLNLFFLLGGSLNILTAIGAPWIAHNINAQGLLFLLYGLSALLFFVLYYYLINNCFFFQKGAILTFLSGALSATFQVIGEIYRYELKGIIEIVFMLSPILIWQTLFAVSIKLSAKKPVEMPIQNTVTL